MGWKCLALPLFLAVLLPSERLLWAEDTVETIVDKNAAAVENFLGFGAEWDPLFWHDFNVKAGVTKDDWALIRKRIRWMRLPIVRMMMQLRWVYRDDFPYDWNSREMKSLRAHLDVCRSEGITVILTDWGIETWAKVPDIADTADPRYAARIFHYMDYLLHHRGYSCIKYFILVNEPNYEVKDFARWKSGVQNVADTLKTLRAGKKVRLLGADAGQGDMNWHEPAVDQLQDVLDGYDVHLYADDKDMRAGKVEEFFRRRWEYVLENDPQARGKPLIVGEAGMNDGAEHPRGNRNVDKYCYGVFMADYAVQAARAGSSAVCAWMLDDTCHEGFFWGMWADKKGGFSLRPWFYTWSLLSRYFPPGSTLYAVEQPENVRILAGRTTTGHGGGWTFCIVNRGETLVSLRLRIPDERPASFHHYLYSRKEARKDDDGFPVPVSRKRGEPDKGIPLTCPADAVLVVTSLSID